MNKLREAAEILSESCCGVSVYGDTPVCHQQVRRIAREWLELTKGIQPAAPPVKRSLWSRLLGSAPGEINE